MFFSHTAFPGIRFGRRYGPYLGALADAQVWDQDVWLKEHVETGALHRMMSDSPSADHDGVIWTTWGVE